MQAWERLAETMAQSLERSAAGSAPSRPMTPLSATAAMATTFMESS